MNINRSFFLSPLFISCPFFFSFLSNAPSVTPLPSGKLVFISQRTLTPRNGSNDGGIIAIKGNHPPRFTSQLVVVSVDQATCNYASHDPRKRSFNDAERGRANRTEKNGAIMRAILISEIIGNDDGTGITTGWPANRALSELRGNEHKTR